jgi:hypothetical protein
MITPSHLAKAFSYPEYCELIHSLLARNKTTGEDHSPAMIESTRINVQRMQELDATLALDSQVLARLQGLTEPLIWVVLTEAWSIDAAQTVPLIARMADASPAITLKILLRDENPDILPAYWTRHHHSIPSIICLDADTLEDLGIWSYRVQPVKTTSGQAYHWGVLAPDFDKLMEDWYANEKIQALQRELIQLLEQWTQNVMR